MAYWYNVSTRQVETEETRGPAVDLLGPFPTREEAERAIETVHARTKRADDADAAWVEGGNAD